jgi:alpha-tubulin suppressor-like RCC1 family protein
MDEISYFSYLPNDQLFEIALQLNINDLNYYCLYNSRFNNLICDNNEFWKAKFLYDFGEPDYDLVTDWKSLYKNHGTVYVFGDNRQNLLGLHASLSLWKPTKLSNFKFKVISAGDYHTVVLDFKDEVWTFGNNRYGQLGLGDENFRATPTKISFAAFNLPDLQFKSIAAGGAHTVAIDFNNDIWVFGSNAVGQLGLGDTRARFIPEKIPNLKGKFIVAGMNHTIVMDLTNSLWVFGSNEFGQLGLNVLFPAILTPMEIEGFKVKFISTKYNHTVALDFNNNVWVFGANSSGQLGLGDNRARFTPTQIPARVFGSPNFRAKAIVAGGAHTVVLDFNDEVWTFGNNRYGQLGLYDENFRAIPTKIPAGAFGLPKFKNIFAGGYHTMAIDFNNEVWVCGSNADGQLGLGDNKNRSIPTKIPNFKANEISAGRSYTMVLSDYNFM